MLFCSIDLYLTQQVRSCEWFVEIPKFDDLLLAANFHKPFVKFSKLKMWLELKIENKKNQLSIFSLESNRT